jgi:hypothetical protein
MLQPTTITYSVSITLQDEAFKQHVSPPQKAKIVQIPCKQQNQH